MAEPAKVIETQSPAPYRIKESQIQRFEFNNTRWDVDVDVGCVPEDCARPEFWGNVAQPRNMRIGDEFRVRPHDRSWTVYGEVLDCGPAWARVDIISLRDRRSQEPAGETDVAKGFSVVWQGPANKYVVMRDADKAVISRGHKDKSEAHIAMIEHAKTVG